MTADHDRPGPWEGTPAPEERKGGDDRAPGLLGSLRDGWHGLGGGDAASCPGCPVCALTEQAGRLDPATTEHLQAAAQHLASAGRELLAVLSGRTAPAPPAPAPPAPAPPAPVPPGAAVPVPDDDPAADRAREEDPGPGHRPPDPPGVTGPAWTRISVDRGRATSSPGSRDGMTSEPTSPGTRRTTDEEHP